MIRPVAIIDKNQFGLVEYVDAEGGGLCRIQKQDPLFWWKLWQSPLLVSKKCAQKFCHYHANLEQKKERKNKGHKLETRL